MKEAADAGNLRSQQLKEGLKISILVFAGQIPILFGFISINRSNACFCFTNLVWFSTAIVCIGLTFVTFQQGAVSQENIDFCANYDQGNIKQQEQFSHTFVHEGLQPLIDVCIFGSDGYSISNLMNMKQTE